LGESEFSKETILNIKWDALAEMCTGSNKAETGVESVDKKSEQAKIIY
jgi:hypothetical protein